MALEMLMALEISDETNYARYRAAIAPLLIRHGGSFRYDFKIAQVLKAETEQPINRVFIIRFESEASKLAFFADPEYKVAKTQFYEPSVSARTPIAEYEN